jgi:putative acetyltransferase
MGRIELQSYILSGDAVERRSLVVFYVACKNPAIVSDCPASVPAQFRSDNALSESMNTAPETALRSAKLELRSVRGSDRAGIIRLIDTIFREYGDQIFLDDADKDLLDIPSHYEEGLFVVLADGTSVFGTAALQRHRELPEVALLRRMYLDARLRGTGAGARLLDWAVEKARELGMGRMELWTDSRFTRAHGFYKKMGFTDSGEVRSMDDGFMPYDEFMFYREL